MEVFSGSIMLLAVAALCAALIPGLERKVHARIQNRYGPPVTTPGLWNMLKFLYKRRIKSTSPSPRFYYSFVVVSVFSVAAVILFSNPLWWGVLGFGSVFAVMGLLKIEESMYLFMGSFSKSLMSLGMPFPDLAKGGKLAGARAFFEEVSAARSLKMITIGSFPIYMALFIPFAVAGSMMVQDVVEMQNPLFSPAVSIPLEKLAEMLSFMKPFALTLPGVLATVVYFIGYNILTNTRPFDIIKPKIDVIEGPVLEYAAVWRGMYYGLTGLLSFTLSSLFITFFLGIPLALNAPPLLILHLLLIPILPASSAVLRAFSPVFTFRQIYPVSLAATVLAFTSLALTLLRF